MRSMQARRRSVCLSAGGSGVSLDATSLAETKSSMELKPGCREGGWKAQCASGSGSGKSLAVGVEPALSHASNSCS